jgi:hypothetical protein
VPAAPDIVSAMNSSRLTRIVASVVLALVIFSGGTIPQRRHAEQSQSFEHTCLSTSTALSDFDADGVVDEARLEGSASRKCVGILLCGTGRRSFLHFDTNRTIQGSLHAQDIDNDGATDLIWTDTLGSHDVLVWLGDGNGRFEQADFSWYPAWVKPGNTSIAEPDESSPENAIAFETERPLGQTSNPRYLDHSSNDRTVGDPDPRTATSPALSQPSGRAPPFSLA